MPTGELVNVQSGIPFPLEDNLVDSAGGPEYIALQWIVSSGAEIPPWWSRSRDRWLRNFVNTNGPIKTAITNFINKLVTIPFSIEPKERSITRHVMQAMTIEEVLRRASGSMSTGPFKGFKNTMKMFVRDYLTQDNGAFMLAIGNGPADGPIVGAPLGLLHLDSALCTRTRDPEFPVKYLNGGYGSDNLEYKIHYTRIIEMVNLPSSDVTMNGVGLCPVSCCIEAAQELYDVYRYNREMFGSAPPRQILYAKKGATIRTMEDAIKAWRSKLESDNRTHFGGTLIMAPSSRNGIAGAEMELDTLDLARMPENFNRRDVTTIDKSEIAAAFGLDLRDLAYTLGAPSRTGDAEVQDRKGRGKGIGEFVETFVERMHEVYVNRALFIVRFDNQDDEQDEQRALIRDKRSAGRERDLRAGVTTIRTERELMWENDEITYEQFAQMELEDGRLPEGLDVLLLFQSQDRDFHEWLDLGVADPTDIADNDAIMMADLIHERFIEISTLIHEENRVERRRKARQALAALDKLRSMYQVPEGQAIGDEATVEAMADGSQETSQPQNSSAPANVPTEDNSIVKQLRQYHSKQIETDDPQLQQYERQFRYLIEQAIAGQVGRERFEGALEQIVAAILLSLFANGAFMSVSEFSDEAWAAINQEIDTHMLSLQSFAEDIYDNHLYSDGATGLDRALTRIATWVTIATGIYFLGMTFRQDDPYLRWNYSILKEHCSDCVRLNGQVHRASEWRAAGYRPRSFDLECRGLNCGCYFTQVNGPAVGAF